MFKNLQDKLLGFLLGITIGVPLLVFAQNAYLDLYGSPSLITASGQDLTLGTAGDDTLEVRINEVTEAVHSSSALTLGTNDLTLTAGDMTLTAGDLVVTAGDLSIPAAANLALTGESAANTACDTTCTLGCVAGFDTGSSVFVACTDATADTCLCAGV